MKLFIALVFASVITFMAPTPTYAAVGKSFGGLIYVSFPCTCSTGQYIITGLPTPGAYWVPPATQLYRNFRVYTPGAYVLGSYTPGGTCSIYVGEGCVSLTVQGTVTMAGTS